ATRGSTTPRTSFVLRPLMAALKASTEMDGASPAGASIRMDTSATCLLSGADASRRVLLVSQPTPNANRTVTKVCGEVSRRKARGFMVDLQCAGGGPENLL